MQLKPTAPTVKAPAARFTGDVYLNMLEEPGQASRLAVGLVRFTPGARTNWHSHALGQTLHITEGVGLVGTRDGQVLRIRAGQTVTCPPGEDHWHGATAENFMAHIAIVVDDGSGNSAIWFEPVTDVQYEAANRQ